MAKAERATPDVTVRRLEELLNTWKAPKGSIDGGFGLIERLIALRNREVKTVAEAMTRMRYVEAQRDEAIRHLADLVRDHDGAETAARKLLAYYR